MQLFILKIYLKLSAASPFNAQKSQAKMFCFHLKMLLVSPNYTSNCFILFNCFLNVCMYMIIRFESVELNNFINIVFSDIMVFSRLN